MKQLTRLSVLWVIILFSCHSEQREESLITGLKTGSWVMNLHLNDTIDLPFNFEITENQTLIIQNGEEKITTQSIKLDSDSSFSLMLPVFNSEFKGKLISQESLEGNWHNYNKKDDYRIPFLAYFGRNRFEKNESNQEFPKKWEVTFGDNDNNWKALGIFENEKGKITGTFLTETGDYRFLEGVLSNDTLKLSCFDGAHAFLFEAKLKGDSLIDGSFRSGNHYKTSWHAITNDNFQLTHPDSLTYLKEGYDKLAFSFPNLDSSIVSLNDKRFQNKVVIVQVLGTWCPNCMDETMYYTELHSKYNNQGLEIIGLAFEATEDFDKAVKSVKKMKTDLGVEYPILIAGKASKKEAGEKLPILNHVMSFPTSVFMDREGEIKRIHTGFYGKGTGSYFNEYAKETEALIQKLLAQ